MRNLDECYSRDALSSGRIDLHGFILGKLHVQRGLAFDDFRKFNYPHLHGPFRACFPVSHPRPGLGSLASTIPSATLGVAETLFLDPMILEQRKRLADTANSNEIRSRCRV